MLLFDHYVDTMLLHNLLFELSPDADVDQVNNPLSDPKRRTKTVIDVPQNKLIAALDACSLSLQARKPVGPRTPVGSFDAGTARVAPNFPIRCIEEERTLLSEKNCQSCRFEYSTSDCEHQVNSVVSPPEIPRNKNVSPIPLSHPSEIADRVAPTHKPSQGTGCGSHFA